MYHIEKHLTLEVAAEVVSRFEWPAPYTLEDELPDGIMMIFPACRLLLAEGFEGEVAIRFLVRDTGLPSSVDMDSALNALVSEAERAGAPFPRRSDLGLIRDASHQGSLDRVKNELHDQCAITLAYFRNSLLGDFRWVESYRAYLARNAR
jgi:hypothetical protein